MEVFHITEGEPLPYIGLSKEQLDAFSPERRAQFEEAAEVFSDLAATAKSGLGKEFAERIRDTFTAQTADLLSSFQQVVERRATGNDPSARRGGRE